ncbi:hypothetical protein COFA105466_01665 [Corynebacterium falsenii]
MTDTVGQLHATPSADEATYNEKRLNRRRMTGLFVGIALAVIVYLISPSTPQIWLTRPTRMTRTARSTRKRCA